MRPLCCAILLISLTAAAPTAEGSRQGATYYVGRTGSTWSYATDKGRAKVIVDSVENWAAHCHVAGGKRSVGGVWRAREGAWVQKLPERPEAVILPAQVTVGTRWAGPASIERGGAASSIFEVISMDAQVELA